MRDPSVLATRAETARRAGAGDALFRITSLLAALAVLIIFGGVIVSLLIGATPAMKAFGFNFIVEEAWRPTREHFGALAPVNGTLITSAIAMLIALPVGIGIAIFLTELCPRPLRRPIGIAIELLAAAQGVDLRAPFETSPKLRAVMREIRSRVPHYDIDRYLAPDIAAMTEAVRSGVIAAHAPQPH